MYRVAHVKMDIFNWLLTDRNMQVRFCKFVAKTRKNASKTNHNVGIFNQVVLPVIFVSYKPKEEKKIPGQVAW